MAERLLDSSLVLFTLAVIYLLPTWPAVRLRSPERSGWDVLLTAAALGVASQGIIGFVWVLLGLRSPGMESLLYLGGWAALSLAAFKGARVGGKERRAPSAGMWLLAILAAGVALRLVHPLTNAALGQSDAYSHLAFLKDIVHRGHLRNLVYPSGYHWVLALPSLWFKVDPYLIARYGGAFFGGLLIVAAGLFAGDGKGRKAGLATALLVALFPGFMPLIKTGVGAFANQMGLLFLLLTLREYLSCTAPKEGLDKGRLPLLAVYFSALAVSVPLMTIQAAAFIAVERTVALLRGPRQAARILPLLPALLPALLLIALHAAGLNQRSQKRSARMITSGFANKAAKEKMKEGKVSKAESSPARLSRDLFSVKRGGLGSPLLNTAAALLLAAFSLLLARGILSGKTLHTGVGIWGLFALVQTVTGFLEFSAYQRAGWSLMLATALLGGLLYEEAERYGGKRCSLALFGVAGALAVWAFAAPPRHVFIMSSAETELVRVARALAQDHRFSRTRWLSFERMEAPGVVRLLDPSRPLRILTRNFSTMKARQGNPVAALLGRETGISLSEISKPGKVAKAAAQGEQILFLLDRAQKLSPGQLGVAATLNPRMSRTFARWQFRLYDGNDDLRALLKDLEREGWRATRVNVGPNLEAVAAEPPGGAS